MSKADKIKAVMDATQCSRDDAEAYLDAEDWIVFEAIYDIRAERKNGI
ncbi:TPA: hypothetical protein QDB21_005619 [Burkholderia vietnamiensis]|nr:hypothetical protein [Burkholderia vietnamiensis]